ncbi:hypothetical protein [Microbacterium plantarum]|uniref:hypothetical protein n=1 Tax=Microbacterium plantarum TaxID=1816425 RepID=UPI002B468830|nr:hypothetical protein [Microbacterium plantarum]WRK18583.1 hypothetical protein VC184_06130 [Microbacterium plantarum]
MTGAGPQQQRAPRRDSPRTDAEPLAFTRAEFLAGIARAWGATTLLLIVAWAVLTGGFSLVVGTVMILVVSVPAVVIGSPGAYALGRLLRRSPRVGAHLIAFTAYGALVGFATTAVALPLLIGDSGDGWIESIAFLVNVPLSALGLAGAWFITMRRALRLDAEVFGDVVPTSNPDAATEDALDENYRIIYPDRRRRQRPRG